MIIIKPLDFNNVHRRVQRAINKYFVIKISGAKLLLARRIYIYFKPYDQTRPTLTLSKVITIPTSLERAELR